MKTSRGVVVRPSIFPSVVSEGFSVGSTLKILHFLEKLYVLLTILAQIHMKQHNLFALLCVTLWGAVNPGFSPQTPCRVHGCLAHSPLLLPSQHALQNWGSLMFDDRQVKNNLTKESQIHPDKVHLFQER